MTIGDVVIDYTNHRGERAVRRIRPQQIAWSEGDQYHPEPQWVLHAFDYGKNAGRTFAIKDIHDWRNATENNT